MEIVVHSKNSLFEQKFQTKLPFQQEFSTYKFDVKIIQLYFWSPTKNLALTPSVVSNPTPPKNLQLRNSICPC